MATERQIEPKYMIQLNKKGFMKSIVVCMPKNALRKGKGAGEMAQWLKPHAKGEKPQ